MIDRTIHIHKLPSTLTKYKIVVHVIKCFQINLFYFYLIPPGILRFVLIINGKMFEPLKYLHLFAYLLWYSHYTVRIFQI